MNNRNNGLQRETGGKIVFEDMHCMNIYSRRQRAKQPRLRECLARCRKGQIPQSPTAKNKFHAPSALLQGHLACGNKNGSNGARTHDLSRVRRTLIPAELCFQMYTKNGPEGIRTLGLRVANAALSQLSHEPICFCFL